MVRRNADVQAPFTTARLAVFPYHRTAVVVTIRGQPEKLARLAWPFRSMPNSTAGAGGGGDWARQPTATK